MKADVNRTLVTIGIPTRNRSSYLVKAVQSALAQTHKQIEIIVSDNASTDDTALRMQEIGDPRLVFIRQPENLGMVGNFNACLKAASGALFLMLSDDDLLDPEAIEQLSRPFLQSGEDDDVGLTWCPCEIINSGGEVLWTSDAGPSTETPASLFIAFANGERGLRFCSVMVRTIDALAVGGYNGERYGTLCDGANWAASALRHKSVSCIARPLVKNMVHPASATSSAGCREWQLWGDRMYSDLCGSLLRFGISERTVRSSNRNLIACLTAYSLIPNVGQPGWFLYSFREVLRAWRNFLTLAIARRVFRETWKITRFRQRRVSA